MELVIVVDAVVVLCGAVLTSYVGVTGLVKRMTLDRILPQVLLREPFNSAPLVLVRAQGLAWRLVRR